jgi:subtilisin family serine protease
MKFIKILAVSFLWIFLSSCGGKSSSPAAVAVDNSLSVSSINEQATLKNVAKTVTLYATDSSYTQALTFTAASSSASVVATISDSTLTLTPATGFSGTSTITVKAYDGTLYSSAQTFTFTICDSACAPVLDVINADATTKNTAKNITLSATDANGDSLTYSATSSTSNVVPSFSGSTLTLTPVMGWTGTATITAKASDSALDSSVKTFTFKVCDTACLPTLASVSNQSTTEDTAKVITLVGADPDGDALAYSAISSSCNVTTTISGSTLTLHPKANWSGTATITAHVNDGTHVAAQAFVLTVSAVNDAPVLLAIANQTTSEDTSKTVTLTGTDIEGSSLTYSATSSNSSNVATSVSGTTLTLTPSSNFVGTVTITAKANDGTVYSAAKTFTLTVGAVNDAPVVGTVANQTTAEDTEKTVTLSVTDSDSGDSHTYTATSSSSNVVPSLSGATLRLNPRYNWSGTETITIKANDGTVDSAAKTFTLTVSAVNDAPILTSVANQTTLKNSAKTVTFSGYDVEGSSLTYSATSSNSSNVSTFVSGTTLTLTPANNFVGTVTITAKANDGTVDSATKTFTITVNASNTAPVVGTIANQSTNEDTFKTLVFSGTDADGDSLTYSATSSTSNVTAYSSIVYGYPQLKLTPAANWSGTATITIKANDGIVYSPTKTFTLTVSAVNDAPVLASISAQATAKNTAKIVTLSGSDADTADSLTYSATSSASQVTPSVTGNVLTLTPATNWTGTSTITAKANDGTVDSAAKTFVITVGNTAPTLAAISAQATNQSVKKTVSITAADGDGDSLSYSVASSPSSKVSGAVSGSTLTLTPLATYSGTAAVTLTVSDGTATAARTFNLVVTANDPLYKYQWHLDNTGQPNFSGSNGTSTQDINVDGAITDGYDGDGIIVAIVDSGLELAHEDLSPNIVSGGSWDYAGNDNDPTNSSSTGDHGTSVGGLTCSAGWNGKGGRGVAPSCSLKGFNILSQYTTANAVASHGGASYAQDVDVFNQSYGLTGLYGHTTANATEEAQMSSATTNLRSGKGALFVKSAGNSYNGASYGGYYYSCDTQWGFNTGLTCQNSTSQPPNNWPYNIVVGALGATGVKSSYSTAGSNLWISAPGGEYGTSSPAMMTTDQSGCSKGYVRSGVSSSNAFNNNCNHSENSNGNYTATFNGTSSAGPVAAGAIALILQANPALTWRDVKHILATTSDQVDASKSAIVLAVNGVNYTAVPAWTTNNAGHKFHDWYGFGRVNVGAAITAAQSYSAGSLGSLNITNFTSNTSGTISSAIPVFNAAGVTNTIAVSETEIIEAVQIQVSATHPSTGSLAIELVSPAGTRSVLKTPYDFFLNANNLSNMVLTSNAFYGEETDGNWTIRVIDAANWESGSRILTKWSIRFYEH